MNPTAVAQSSHVDQLLARLQEARAQSDELFDIVRPAALYDRPIPERHRIIFYLGHLEAFDWNLLGAAGTFFLRSRHSTSFSPSASIPWTAACRPTSRRIGRRCEQVRAYNARLRETLDARASRLRQRRSELARLEHGRLLEVAIEHRLMHCRNAVLHAAPVAHGPQIQPPDRPCHRRRHAQSRAALKFPQEWPPWDSARGERHLSAGTTSSRNIALRFPRSRSTPTT